MNDPAEGAPVRPAIGLFEILRCFTHIGATGFGGVLPIAMHELVERRRWLTRDEFAEILSLCQILPGANVINIAIVFGMRVAGWWGAVASVVGILALPIAIVLTLAALYAQASEIPAVQAATRAVASAAAGLISAMALRLLWPMLRQPARIAVVALVLVLIVGWRLPLVTVIAVVAPLSILLAYLEHRRG